jgi:hypothetical protein
MILIICFSFWECIFVFLQINTNQINLRDYEKRIVSFYFWQLISIIVEISNNFLIHISDITIQRIMSFYFRESIPVTFGISNNLK